MKFDPGILNTQVSMSIVGVGRILINVLKLIQNPDTRTVGTWQNLLFNNTLLERVIRDEIIEIWNNNIISNNNSNDKVIINECVEIIVAVMMQCYPTMLSV